MRAASTPPAILLIDDPTFIREVLGLGMLLSLLSLVACCATDKMVSVESPSRTRSLLSYRQNCGATTDWATVVELTTSSFLGAKRVQDVLVLKGDIDIEMKWLDDNNAVIIHGPGNVHMSLENAGGVHFTFSTR